MDNAHSNVLTVHLVFDDSAARDALYDRLQEHLLGSPGSASRKPDAGFELVSLETDLEPGAFDSEFLIWMTIGIVSTSAPIAAWWFAQNRKPSIRIDGASDQAKALVSALVPDNHPEKAITLPSGAQQE